MDVRPRGRDREQPKLDLLNARMQLLAPTPLAERWDALWQADLRFHLAWREDHPDGSPMSWNDGEVDEVWRALDAFKDAMKDAL